MKGCDGRGWTPSPSNCQSPTKPAFAFRFRFRRSFQFGTSLVSIAIHIKIHSHHNATQIIHSLTITPLPSSQIGKPLQAPFTTPSQSLCLYIYISLTRRLHCLSLFLSTGNGSHTLRLQVRYLAFSSRRSKHSFIFFSISLANHNSYSRSNTVCWLIRSFNIVLLLSIWISIWSEMENDETRAYLRGREGLRVRNAVS